MKRSKVLDPQTLGYELLRRGNAELSRLRRVGGAYREPIGAARLIPAVA